MSALIILFYQLLKAYFKQKLYQKVEINHFSNVVESILQKCVEIIPKKYLVLSYFSKAFFLCYLLYLFEYLFCLYRLLIPK